MKTTILILFVILLGFATSYAQPPPKKHVYPKIDGNAKRVMKWESTELDLGKIQQGIPATVTFKFVNTGDSAISLTDVHASCTCTSPSWSKGDILPGKEGFVTVGYNAAVSGPFAKSISVTTSKGEIAILTIRGEVVGMSGPKE